MQRAVCTRSNLAVTSSLPPATPPHLWAWRPARLLPGDRAAPCPPTHLSWSGVPGNTGLLLLPSPPSLRRPAPPRLLPHPVAAAPAHCPPRPPPPTHPSNGCCSRLHPSSLPIYTPAAACCCSRLHPPSLPIHNPVAACCWSRLHPPSPVPPPPPALPPTGGCYSRLRPQVGGCSAVAAEPARGGAAAEAAARGGAAAEAPQVGG